MNDKSKIQDDIFRLAVKDENYERLKSFVLRLGKVDDCDDNIEFSRQEFERLLIKYDLDHYIEGLMKFGHYLYKCQTNQKKIAELDEGLNSKEQVRSNIELTTALIHTCSEDIKKFRIGISATKINFSLYDIQNVKVVFSALVTEYKERGLDINVLSHEEAIEILKCGKFDGWLNNCFSEMYSASDIEESGGWDYNDIDDDIIQYFIETEAPQEPVIEINLVHLTRRLDELQKQVSTKRGAPRKNEYAAIATYSLTLLLKGEQLYNGQELKSLSPSNMDSNFILSFLKFFKLIDPKSANIQNVKSVFKSYFQDDEAHNKSEIRFTQIRQAIKSDSMPFNWLID